MKPIVKEFLTAAVMGLVLPGVLLNLAVKRQKPDGDVPTETMPEITVSTEPRPKATVYVSMEDGSVAEMDMNAYLTGVVLAEMPASFETEALKAQAVVARTYTLKMAQSGKHIHQTGGSPQVQRR